VRRTRDDDIRFGSTGVPIFTGSVSYAYDSYGDVVQTTVADPQNSHTTVTDYGLRNPDSTGWNIGRVDSIRIRASDATAANGQRLLAMMRVGYDDAGGFPWRVRRAENYGSIASMKRVVHLWRSMGASTCQAEITAKLAHWVTVNQAFTYDANGNLTGYDGVHTQNADLTWTNRTLLIGYDEVYRSLPARITNELGHVATRSYDLAGRVTHELIPIIKSRRRATMPWGA
jgi:hypothetical protein